MKLFKTILLILAATLLLSASAQAAGTPNLQINAAATNPLYGSNSSVTLNGSLGSGQVPGYNLTFRVVLPAGISYAGGSSIAPRVLSNAPSPGQTTLIFSNVSDLVANSTQGLSFSVAHDPLLYGVGDSYTINYDGYVNSDPRFVPRFTSTGAIIPGTYTGSDSDTTVSTISAIRITKSEPSREGEILRGLHSNQTTYSLVVTNNDVNPTENVFIDDYLPAELEFLGCAGNPDHTTDAPTNPGSPQEYPGSGPIVVGAVADCFIPVSVETVSLSAGNPEGIPAGVYTHVRWNLGTMAPNSTRTYRYRAAVPLAENTMNWTGTTPSPASLGQSANLDNNSGPEILDDQGFTNYAFVSGDYLLDPIRTGTQLSRSAEDVLIYKDRNTGNLSQGGLTTWTLTFRTGEYRYGEDITVTDTLPNGLCPLGSINYTTGNDPSDSECDPTGADPSAPYSSVVENANGTFTIVWEPSAAAKLQHSTPNDTWTITFPTRTRTHYQNNFEPTTPILSGDSVTNSVELEGDAYSRCTSPGAPDCDPLGPRIWSNGQQPETVTDSSSASQTAQFVNINKEVATSGTDCLTATYASTPPNPVYAPGDKICWRLTVSFPSAVDTGTQPITDFLPPNTTFIPGSETVTPLNTTSNTFDSSAAGDGVLSWSVDGGAVPTGSRVFQVVFATTVTPESGIMEPVDVTGNLLKVSTNNTSGQAFPMRDQVDFETAIPTVTLNKGIRQVNGGPINNPPAGTATVRGGDTVVYQVDVPAADAAVENVEVWDFLPTGWTCAAVSAISDSGSCSAGRISWTIPSIAADATHSLTYTVTVPTTVSPNESYTNHAGVRQYETESNIGTTYTYIPEDNIDPANPNTPNVTAADDTAVVTIPNVTIAKTRTTSITQLPGNNAADQATIGEFVNYVVTVTLPRGSSFATNPRITDTPNSATLQPVTATSATLNGNPIPGGWTLTTVGNLVTLQLPNGYTVPTGADDVVVLNIQTRIANVSGNLRSNQRSNAASFAWTGGSPHTVTSSTVQTRIVEPQISQTKVNNVSGVAQPDQIVTYTLTTRNSNSTYVSYANDTTIVDNVPLGITPIDGGGTPIANGAVVPGTGGAVWSSGTRTITLTGVNIAPNTNVVWTYTARVDNPSVGGSTKTNNANASTTSIGGIDSNERTGSSATNTGYIANSSSSFQVGAATINKTASRTSGTIGDPIRYTATVGIPAGIELYNLTVVDTLPDSLDYDGFVSATCTSGCPASPAPVVQNYTPVINGDGTTTVAWDLGDVAPGANARTIEIVYDTHIRATHRNGGTPVLNGQTVANRIWVQNNFTDKYTFNPASLPARASYDYSSADVIRNTSIVEPSVSIDKAVRVNTGSFVQGPANTQPGDTYTYRIVATNNGTSPAYDMVVEDEPDADLENVILDQGSGFNTKNWSPSDRSMIWEIPGPVAAGASVTLTYTASLKPSADLATGATVVNTADLSEYFGLPEATRDLNPTWIYREYTGNTDTVQLNVRFPALQINKTTGASGFPDSAPADIGVPFSWRIVVRNNDTFASAIDTIVTDTLPPDWDYVSGSTSITGATAVAPTVTSQPSGDELVWNFSGQTLDPSSQMVITFQATPSLDAYSNPGNNINSAVAATEDITGATGNASGAYVAGPDTATAVLRVPNLQVSKTPDAGSLNAGASMNWSIQIQNTGTGAAPNVSVSDVLPIGMIYTPGTATATPSTGFSETSVVPSNGNGTTTTAVDWNIANIPASGSVTITVPVASLSSIPNSTNLINNVQVSTPRQPNTVTDQGNVVTAVSADVEALKTYSGAPVAPTAGQNFTYTIGVRNNGPSDAAGVQITDALPSEVSFVSAESPCVEASGEITCAVGNLPAGQTRNYNVVVSLASDAYEVENTAVVTASSPDPDPSNNSQTVEFDSTAVADLGIVKTVNPDELNNGETTTYRLVVSNTGPSSARGILVGDALPAGVEFVSVDDLHCTHVSNTVSCGLAELAVGDTFVANITVRATAPGIWTNTGVVSSVDSTDPNPTNNSSSVNITVDPTADLDITKTAPASVNTGPGQQWNYGFRVENLGPDPATGVVVTDTLPTGLVYVSNDSGCSYNTGTREISCALGNLASSGVRNIEVTVYALVAEAGETIINTAVVDGAEYDPDPANNTSEATTTVNEAADLSILKSAPATANINDEVNYGLQVENLGPSDATGVVVTDTIPAGMTYFGNDSGCSYNSGTREVTCSIGNLAFDDARTINITVTVDPGSSTDSITNTAVVVGNEFDPDPANNEDSATTDINPAADLLMTKTGPGDVDVGNNFTYTLRVDNLGPDPATGVLIEDVIPNGLEYVSNDSGCSYGVGTRELLCSVGNLAVSGNYEVEVVVYALASAAGETITNYAITEGNQFDPDPANNEDSVDTDINPAADMEITKTAPATADINQNINYTLTVENNGPSPATNVTVSDTIPTGVTYVSNDSGCSYDTGTRELLCSLGAMSVGTTRTVTVVVQVDAGSAETSIENTAEVDATEYDPDPDNNTSEATTDIDPAADLQITKGAPLNINVDNNFQYTLLARNNGPSDATGVQVTDTLPAGLVYVGNDSGCSYDNGTREILCSIGNMPNGTNTTILITANAPVGMAEETIENTGLIEGNEFDPDPSNNEDTVETDVNPAADMEIEKTAPAQADINDSISYSLLVTNNGPSQATDVAVTDTLPTGVTYVGNDASCSYDTGTREISCALGTMNSGATRTVVIEVTVDPSSYDSSILNSSSVAATEYDPDPDNNVSDATTVIGLAADLAVTKTAPATADVTEPSTYEFRVENLGPSDATGVQVTDTLPVGFNYVGNDSGCSYDADTRELLCSIGNLAVNGVRLIEIQGNFIVASADTTVENTVDVVGDQFDPNTSNNQDTVSTDVQPAADMEITKTADPSVIDQGTNGEFVLTVTNNGPSAAVGVQVTDTLPAELAYVSDDSGCSEASGTITCSLGNMAADSSRVIRITVEGLEDGIWTNVSTVDSDTYDQDESNNTDSADLIVSPTADLALTKTGPATANAHQEITYSFQVENLGPDDATGVVVNDPLPAGLQFVSSDDCNSVMVCSLGNIVSGGTRSFQVVVRTTATIANTNLVNTAEVSGNEYDPDPTNNTSTWTTAIDPLADLGVEKTGAQAAMPGGPINWSLRVYNDGPSTAEAVQLVDTLPAGVEGVTVSNSACSISGSTINCALGNIANGAEVVIDVSGVLADDILVGSTLTNSVVVSTTTDDINPDNETSSWDTTVEPTEAELRITKSYTGPKPAVVGKNLTYEIRVENTGGRPATGVRVIDRIPDSLQFRKTTTTRGTCSYKSGKKTVDCFIQTLPGNSSAVIRVTALAKKKGKVSNTATQTAENAILINTSSTSSTQVRNGTARLSVSKKASVGRAKGGQKVSYRIRVRNTSRSAATDVRTCDILPQGVTVIRTGGGTLSNGRVCWKLSYLAPKRSKTYRLTLRVDRYTGKNKIVNRVQTQAANAKRKKFAKARVRVRGNTGTQPSGGVTG